MVTCNGYRNPALWAKIASTVDVAAHGRLYAGYGAGWYEHEWRAYGYGFPETRDRMRAFREGCEIIHKMWTEDKPTFKGEYYTIDEPINEPRGVRKPHPSFWIGGGGEQVTLKLVARYGDACNLGGPPEQIAHKLDVLKGHCETVGRNYDEIIRSSSTNVFLPRGGRRRRVGDPRRPANAIGASFEDFQKEFVVGTADKVVAALREKSDVGIDYQLVYLPRIAYDHGMIQQFTEQVIPPARLTRAALRPVGQPTRCGNRPGSGRNRRCRVTE